MFLDEMLQNAEEDVIVLTPREVFDKGILGITENGQHIVYGYEALMEALAQDDYANGLYESMEDAYTGAQEWLDFNTIRALPYMGPKAPIIIYEIEKE